MESPRIVFLGTPDFAVASLQALIENKYNVVAVVTAPDKPAGRGMQLKASAVKTFAQEHNIPVLQPEKLKNKEFLAELKSYNADVQVVVAFRMLPEVVWNMPPMGTINVHGSLLPQYRGAAPINWAIINGDKETGVTTFKLQHEIDTGNILLQKKVAILEDDNIGTLYAKLMAAGAELLVTTIDGLINKTIKEVPQQESDELKHAPKIFKEDCLLDFNQSATNTHNRIRGLSPIPAAYTILDNKTLKVYSSTIQIEQHELEPGRIETDQKTFIRIATTDGFIYLNEIQMEGKKRLTVADFLRGYTIKEEFINKK